MLNELAVLLCIGMLLVAGVANIRAWRQLTSDEKVRWADGLSGMFIYSLVPIAFLWFGWIVFPMFPWWISLLGLIAYLLWMLITHGLVIRKFNAMELPRSYIMQQLLTHYLLHVLNVVCYGWIACQLYAHAREVLPE